MEAKSPSLAYRRVVAKLGTNILTAGTSHLDLEAMAILVGQVARLHHQGAEVAVVSSGAIAAGKHVLGVTRERKDIPFRQVLAAVGQSRLMHSYEQLFSWHHISIAQALLTRADLDSRQGYLNVRNTLLALLELRVIPIINENDVVGVEEIEGSRFGDNDTLSALVANLVDADLLVLLTDTEGLYTADPHKDKEARLIPRVDKIDGAIEKLAGEPFYEGGTGGMVTKIQAARLATASGTAVAIASGQERDVLVRLASGEALGTLFPPSASQLESRKRWMLAAASPRAGVVVDQGARSALLEGRKSLLSAGVVEVLGDFPRGEVVSIYDQRENRVGCGIVNYSSSDLHRIKGARSDRIAEILGYEYGSEVIHRNNLALI